MLRSACLTVAPSLDIPRGLSSRVRPGVASRLCQGPVGLTQRPERGLPGLSILALTYGSSTQCNRVPMLSAHSCNHLFEHACVCIWLRHLNHFARPMSKGIGNNNDKTRITRYVACCLRQDILEYVTEHQQSV